MLQWRKAKLNIFLQYSNGVRYPSDLRGLLFSFHSTSAMNSSDNSLKSVPLGIYCLIRPLIFSLAPRFQEWYGLAKQTFTSSPFAISLCFANSFPLLAVIVYSLSLYGSYALMTVSAKGVASPQVISNRLSDT